MCVCVYAFCVFLSVSAVCVYMCENVLDETHACVCLLLPRWTGTMGALHGQGYHPAHYGRSPPALLLLHSALLWLAVAVLGGDSSITTLGRKGGETDVQ